MSNTRKFIDYLNKSPSPWHAVEELAVMLKARGYVELKEATKEAWQLKQGGKYFMFRNQSCLMAFAVGGKFNPAKDGRFSIIGAHTDSPCIRIKPNSKVEKQGFVQVGVECYGGGQWPTWMDRDLRVAGRIIHKRPNGQMGNKLVHINKPFMRIPTLAIHLNRDQGTKLEINKEDHTMPIMAMAKEQIENEAEANLNAHKLNTQGSSIKKRHHSVLLNALSKSSGIEVDDIMDFELCLADYQPAEIGGAEDEFIFGPRLDNLLSSWTAVQALMDADDTLGEDPTCRMVSCFDHEEVGSQSGAGAGSALPKYILKRICYGVDKNIDPCAFERAMPRSFCISADMAHACHPNYISKHESRMQLTLTDGPAIKYNANQRYATNAETASIIRDIAWQAGVPLQEICNRNDVPCGSTIGPITSANLGIPTIDMGAPQFSMHSVREMCHVVCVDQCTDLFTAFFNKFAGYQMSSEEGFKHEADTNEANNNGQKDEISEN